MGPSLPHASLRLRIIKAVVTLNNDVETESSVTANITIITLLLYGSLSPRVWEALSSDETLILRVMLTLSDIPAVTFIPYFTPGWIYDVSYICQKLWECQELWAAGFYKSP